MIAAVYVGFAVADGRPKVIAVESSVTFAFVVVAAAAVTGSPWLLVAGLAGHGLKDLWQHRTHFVANTRWWPPFCMVVDWVVAAIIAGRDRRGHALRLGAAVVGLAAAGAYPIRSSIRTRTVSPACLPIASRSFALTGQPMRAVALRHERAVERLAVDRAADLHQPARAEERGGVVHDDARPRTRVVALLKLGVELSQHDTETLSRDRTRRQTARLLCERRLRRGERGQVAAVVLVAHDDRG